MDVSAARDGGEIVEGAELSECGQTLQHAEVERGAADPSAGEADASEFGTLCRNEDVFGGIVVLPKALSCEFLFEEPLGWRVLDECGHAGLDLWFAEEPVGEVLHGCFDDAFRFVAAMETLVPCVFERGA